MHSVYPKQKTLDYILEIFGLNNLPGGEFRKRGQTFLMSSILIMDKQTHQNAKQKQPNQPLTYRHMYTHSTNMFGYAKKAAHIYTHMLELRNTIHQWQIIHSVRGTVIQVGKFQLGKLAYGLRPL